MPNPGPATTLTPHYLLQADSSDGYLIASLSTTPIGMYGVSGVPQRSNANQLNVTGGAPGGALLSVRTVALSALPNTAANGTLSAAFTCTSSPISSGDAVIVNAITSFNAGTGIGGVRAHTATAGAVIMQLVNLSAGNLSPTAGQQYLFAGLRGLTRTLALTPSVVSPNTISEQTFNVTGVAPGDFVYVSKPSEQSGLAIAGCRAAGNNQLAITFLNVTAVPITPTAAETYTYFASSGQQAASNLIVYGVNVGTLAAVVTASTSSWVVTEQSITVSSIRTSDFLVGVSKPAAQAQLGIVGQRVASANTIGISFASGNITGVTPTASEIYPCLVYRQQPDAPLLLTTATCAPSAIAGSTTVEQAFTVSPLPADSIVWVNKPTATNGIGIVGCRVSAAGVVGITFANTLVSTTVTPPTESYLFGVITPTPSGGSSINMQVQQGAQGALDKSNELTTALTALGAITGGTP